MIEIEKRAKISKEEYEKLLDFFGKNGLKLTGFARLTLVHIWREDWKPSKQTPQTPFDLKIRTGDPESSIAVKREVDSREHSRHEFELEFPKEKFAEHVELLVNLGFKRFVATSEHRTRFKVKEFNVSLYHHKTIDTYMIEAELVTEDEGQTEKLEGELDKFFQDLNLKLLSSQETQDILQEMNDVVDYRLDFTEKTAEIREMLHKVFPDFL